MSWSTSSFGPVSPPTFMAEGSRPEIPSLDARLALEKDRMNSGSPLNRSDTRSTSPTSKRLPISSRFKKSAPNRDHTARMRQPNYESVVCRLPQDVYAGIFMECAKLPLDELKNWSWMNVSFVCQSWRNAALQVRKLWTFVDFSNPARTAVSLSRAKGESLSIRAVVGKHNVGSLKSALTSAHQIDSILLQSTPHEISPLLETLAYPHPTLTNLVINATSHECRYPEPDFPLIHQESRLRMVELNASPLFLISCSCPALTHLTLRNLPLSENRSGMHKLLSNLPQLQFLTVSCCTLQGERPASPILLPTLRCLKIEGSLLQVADFLDLVGLPTSCQLSCSLNELDNLSGSLWRLCQVIGMHSYASANDAPLEAITLTSTENSSRYTSSSENNLDFHQSVRISAFGRDHKPDSAIFDINIGPGRQTMTDDVIIVTLAAIWRALFLTSVQTLSLQNIDILTQKTWSQFLRTLPQLRVLDIRGHAPSGLVWALLLDVISPRSRTPRFLAPLLYDIYLHGVDCSSGGYMLSPKGQTNSHVDVDDSRFLDVLVVALDHRRRRKMGLRSLTVTKCENILEEKLAELKLIVSHLIWDIRGKTKEAPVNYRSMRLKGPQSELKHYNRLEAVLS